MKTYKLTLEPDLNFDVTVYFNDKLFREKTLPTNEARRWAKNTRMSLSGKKALYIHEQWAVFHNRYAVRYLINVDDNVNHYIVLN